MMNIINQKKNIYICMCVFVCRGAAMVSGQYYTVIHFTAINIIFTGFYSQLFCKFYSTFFYSELFSKQFLERNIYCVCVYIYIIIIS